MPVTIDIKYEGREARDHMLNMKLLGRSLVGLDALVHDGLFSAVHGRLPRQRERLDVEISVHAPRAACVEINGIVGPLVGVLPIVHEMIVAVGKDFVFQYVSGVLTFLGGRSKQSTVHMDKAFALMSEMHASHERVATMLVAEIGEQRRDLLASEAGWRDLTLNIFDRLRPSAASLVGPVGPACDTLRIAPPTDDDEPTVIDAPMANAIRAKEPLEVSDMTKMTVKVDGLILHSRQLKIEHPQAPGRFLNADVRDPAFDTQPNVYTDAIGSTLEVDAKPSYRQNGELAALHIMDARAA